MATLIDSADDDMGFDFPSDLDEEINSDELPDSDLEDLLDEDDLQVDNEAHEKLLQSLTTQSSNTKKRKLEDVYQHKPENEWELDGRVQMDDLLEALDENAVRKKLAKLTDSSNSKRIAAPLSKPAKARLERKVQFEDTKERLTEWLPTVQHMRRAEHLSFPLPRPDTTTKILTTTRMASNFKPTTDLEKQIDSILKQSGMEEKKLQEMEELQAREMSKEEYLQRQGQLAKLRALMYYQEKKFRRQAKIKSKKYRKLLRKSKERQKLTLEELKEIDPEAAKEEIMKLEYKRAEERMRRRHKNMSKWAHFALKNRDPRFKESIQEHLQRGQELLKKIKGFDSDEEDEEDDLSDSEAEEQDTSEKQATTTEQDIGDPNDDYGRTTLTPTIDLVGEQEDVPKTGVFAMKFMRRAEEKKRKEYNELLEEMDKDYAAWKLKMEKQKKKEEEVEDIPADSDDSEDETNETRRKLNQQMKNAQKIIASQPTVEELKTSVGGRHKFAPRANARLQPSADKDAAADENSTLPNNSSDGTGFEVSLSGPLTFDVDMKTKQRTSTFSKPAPPSNSSSSAQAAEPVNPWLVPSEDEPNTDEKARSKKNKRTEKKKKDEEKMQLDLERLKETLEARNNEDEPIFNLGVAAASEEQRELINRAFSADHITEEDLQREKDEEAAEENEVEEEYAEKLLPGWGEWTGAGIQPSKRRLRLLEEMKQKKEQRQKELLEQRADAKLKHVVINQKKDKKMAKYQVADVPYPFTSREAYEKSLRMPIGKAWNTGQVHRALIRPKISTKSGTIITPIQKKLV